jgi:hypothetical protein
MNCVEFERELVRLLAGEESEPGRERPIDALRDHAASCGECGGTDELLEFLALPAGERDIADPPDESYWEELQTAVRRRAAAAERPSRRLAFAAAAAVLLAAVIGIWSLRGAWLGGDEPPRADARATDRLPPDLDELLREAAPEEVVAGVDFLAGLAGTAGSPPPLEAAREESALAPRDGWGLPDVEELDHQARDALLEWLRESAGAADGVES